MSDSYLEQSFEVWLRQEDLPAWEREYRFNTTRSDLAEEMGLKVDSVRTILHRSPKFTKLPDGTWAMAVFNKGELCT